MDFLLYAGIRFGAVAAICITVYLLLRFSARLPVFHRVLVIFFSAVGGALFGSGLIWLLAFFGAPFLERTTRQGSNFWDIVGATLAISLGAGIVGFIVCGLIAFYATGRKQKQPTNQTA